MAGDELVIKMSRSRDRYRALSPNDLEVIPIDRARLLDAIPPAPNWH